VSAAPARDLEAHAFLVTGATSGLGFEAALALARRGARVFLGCRTATGGAAAAASLRARAGAHAVSVEPVAFDLGDLSSVRAAATAFAARGVPLAGLVNNAGVAGARGLTPSGVELAFGVNHLGHFLLTLLLEEPLRAGAPSRVVHVASEAHRAAHALDFTALRRPTRSITGLPEYGVSKACNILFSRELARRWAGSGVESFALHPGGVATGIWRRVPRPFRWLVTRKMATPEAGARPIVWCATSRALAGASGRYFDGQREVEPSELARNDALAARLWDESEELAELRPPVLSGRAPTLWIER
jgi:NAD(P)-dependent dehydrogenase (short-subunit alcohol dehydrogenase family)